MATVFLSYRRSDTEGEAGRLADNLQQRLGRSVVFRDVVSISPGDKFDVTLEKQLEASSIVLVLIGSTWLQELKKRSTGQQVDFHRLEIATALKKGKRVIPLLLNNATLPPKEELSDDLVALIRCHTITMRDESWVSDVARLIDAIGRPYRWDLLALRAVIILIAIIIFDWKFASFFAPDQESDYGFHRTLVLSLVGVYGIVELLLGYQYFQKLKQLRH